MRIIVAGCRYFTNYDLMKSTLDNFISNTDSSKVTIISGRAKGADQLGEKYAEDNNLKLAKFEAPWAKMGPSAGTFRNKLMADYAIKDEDNHPVLFAFWDGKSKGTKDMINRAEKMNIETHIIYFDGYGGIINDYLRNITE